MWNNRKCWRHVDDSWTRPTYKRIDVVHVKRIDVSRIVNRHLRRELGRIKSRRTKRWRDELTNERPKRRRIVRKAGTHDCQLKNTRKLGNNGKIMNEFFINMKVMCNPQGTHLKSAQFANQTECNKTINYLCLYS